MKLSKLIDYTSYKLQGTKAAAGSIAGTRDQGLGVRVNIEAASPR